MADVFERERRLKSAVKALRADKARLLAAAKELVSFLEPWTMDYGDADPQIRALNAAIKKTTK